MLAGFRDRRVTPGLHRTQHAAVQARVAGRRDRQVRDFAVRGHRESHHHLGGRKTADLLDGRLATAKVVVAFTVTTSGEVANLSVASTSDPRLNRSVLRAVQAWRYAPIPEPREHMVSFAFSVE